MRIVLGIKSQAASTRRSPSCATRWRWSRRSLRELADIARTTYVPAATIADVYVAPGEHEKAMELLELAVEERAIVSMWLPWERLLDPLRSHPRFPHLLGLIGW